MLNEKLLIDIKSDDTSIIIDACKIIDKEYAFLSSSEALIICTLATRLREITTIIQDRKNTVAENTEYAADVMKKAIENFEPKAREVRNHWRRDISKNLYPHMMRMHEYPEDAAEEAISRATVLLNKIEKVEKEEE